MAARAEEKLVRELIESEGEISRLVRRRAEGYRWKVRLFRLLLGAGFLISWELASGRLIKPFWISRPSQIFIRLWDWITTGFIFPHAIITLEEMLIGFLIGAVLGIAVGFALGQKETVAQVLNPYIMAAFAMPKMALAPLFILWFGIGIESKIVLVVVIVFFLVFFNTYSGVRDVDRDLINIARTMGASEFQITQKIVLPSALVWIYTGLKLSIPYALIGAVVGEMIAASKGLGFLVQSTSGMFDTTGLFASLFVLTAVAVIVNEFCAWSERHFLRWK